VRVGIGRQRAMNMEKRIGILKTMDASSLIPMRQITVPYDLKHVAGVSGR
jgi:hypothetical protein